MRKVMSNCILAAMAVVVSAGLAGDAFAHGEKAQEPFLRMRTMQWYDVKWSTNKLAVNDELVLSGKFRVSPDWSWPRAAAKPDTAFLNVSVPGPVFTRESSFVNGVNMATSTNFELGRDYGFEVKMRARYPGTWHVHSMMNILNAGPLVGPGQYVEVTGNHADFTNPETTLTGKTIDLETYGASTNFAWHIFWGGLGLAWLLYWLSGRLFFSRNRMVAAGRGDELVTMRDKVVAATFLIAAIGGSAYSYYRAVTDNPIQLPLQGARAHVEPLPDTANSVEVKLLKATYRVPGRSMKMQIEVKNKNSEPVRLGEFSTATVRFLNPEVGIQDETTKTYPEYLLAEKGLTVTQGAPIAPGETRIIDIEAQDAAWEVERLSSLIFDPDSRFGGLLMFYGADGKRYMSDVGGVLVPQFI